MIKATGGKKTTRTHATNECYSSKLEICFVFSCHAFLKFLLFFLSREPCFCVVDECKDIKNNTSFSTSYPVIISTDSPVRAEKNIPTTFTFVDNCYSQK